MIEDVILGLLPAELIPFATIGDLPSVQTDSISLVLFDGVANTEYFGGRKGSTIYQPVVKFVTRNHSYETSRAWVNSIKDALQRYTDMVTNKDGPILSCLLVGSPIYLGRSNIKLHEFQVTFNLQIKEE